MIEVGIKKGQEEISRGDGYVHYLDSWNVPWVYAYVKTDQTVLMKYVKLSVKVLKRIK